MTIGMTRSLIGAGLCLALCAAALSLPAQAQRLQYQEMNFDMWCQEHEHLPPARCDKRLPKDDAAFQAYRDTIERYETQQLNQESHDRRVEGLLNYDPSANTSGRPPTTPVRPPQ